MIYDNTHLGWDETFSQSFSAFKAQGYQPARVIARLATQYRLRGSEGECTAVLSGKFLHLVEKGISELPVVGDWAAIEQKGSETVIHGLVDRKTCFARKPAISGGRKMKNGMITGGATARQVLAANIDIVFIVSTLDGNHSTARTERYLTMAAASGAKPVILLNKADLQQDSAEMLLAELARIGNGCAVHAVSAATGSGMDAFLDYMKPGCTVAFLGPSGVGKSTLINRLFGEAMLATGAVNSATGKGRHTTTKAELLIHGSGCMLIDTPGIRELQLWCDGQAVQDSFDDVASLIRQCRFHDCSHTNEPGCAVREALNTGELSRARYQSYRKLDEETARLEARKKQKEVYLGRRERNFWGKG